MGRPNLSPKIMNNGYPLCLNHRPIKFEGHPPKKQQTNKQTLPRNLGSNFGTGGVVDVVANVVEFLISTYRAFVGDKKCSKSFFFNQ